MCECFVMEIYTVGKLSTNSFPDTSPAPCSPQCFMGRVNIICVHTLRQYLSRVFHLWTALDTSLTLNQEHFVAQMEESIAGYLACTTEHWVCAGPGNGYVIESFKPVISK